VMEEERPLWRRAFDAWEKEVAPRVEEYVRTEEFADRAAAAQRANKQAQEAATAAATAFVRFWNLPSAVDMNKVTKQVESMDRRLRAITRKLEEDERGRDDDR